VERGATIADLASEFLARESGIAEVGSSVVVVPTPTDPAGIRTSARGSRTWSAVKYTPMKGEAAVAILASEGLAQVAVSCQHARRSFVPPSVCLLRLFLLVAAGER